MKGARPVTDANVAKEIGYEDSESTPATPPERRRALAQAIEKWYHDIGEKVNDKDNIQKGIVRGTSVLDGGLPWL